MNYTLHHGNCLDVLSTLPDNSVDSIVTDPPYEISFMQTKTRKWDSTGIAFNVDVWKECLRVLKPGGYMVAFGSPKTYHRLAVAIEDAGFDLRDSLMWVFSQGFPKGQNIAIALDKLQGQEPEIVETVYNYSGEKRYNMAGDFSGNRVITKPVTELAQQWEGWNTQLKPAFEPIVLAQKPISEKTIARNIVRWGVGALNIDACRVPYEGKVASSKTERSPKTKDIFGTFKDNTGNVTWHPNEELGRYPATLITDGSDEVVDMFPNSAASKASERGNVKVFEQGEGQWIGESTVRGHNDEGGSAARFFYQAKASKKDREDGLDTKNPHVSVKPTALMEYLIKLITPPNGVTLDPFMGSGSTGKACAYTGHDFIGIDQDSEYVEVARKRIEYAKEQNNVV